jgi:hypothetical protein
VERWALSSSVCLQPQKWCWRLGVRVAWPKLVLGYALGFPLIEEGGMVEEPSWVDVDTIQGWRVPCSKG